MVVAPLSRTTNSLHTSEGKEEHARNDFNAAGASPLGGYRGTWGRAGMGGHTQILQKHGKRGVVISTWIMRARTIFHAVNAPLLL